MELSLTRGAASHTLSHRLPVNRFATAVLAAYVALLLGLVAAPASYAAPFMHGIQANNSILGEDDAGREREMKQMKAIGIDVLRLTFSWKRVATNSAVCAAQTPAQLEDPASACYDWTLYDEIVTRAKKHDMLVLASIYQVPTWATGVDDSYFVGGTTAEFDYVSDRWAAFSKAAATRYTKGSDKGYIPYFTVGNEPNSGFFWHHAANDRFAYSGTLAAKRYAQLYVAAARGIREASPTAKISAGPTGPKGSVAPITFMNIAIPEMQRLGGNGLLDAWSHNPYPPSVRGPRTGKTKPPYIYIGNLSALVKTLDSYSMTKRKPIWATEFAYQTNPPDKNLGISYSLQATFLAEVYDMLASTSRVQMGFWYVFRDNTLDSDWQSGLQNSKGKKKDSYSMYARPISRSTESVKPGKSVRIWGASAVDPRSARIMYSYDKRKWKRAPKEKALGNGTRAVVMSPSKTVYYRITDAKGSGPMRGVKVR